MKQLWEKPCMGKVALIPLLVGFEKVRLEKKSDGPLGKMHAREEHPKGAKAFLI